MVVLSNLVINNVAHKYLDRVLRVFCQLYLKYQTVVNSQYVAVFHPPYEMSMGFGDRAVLRMMYRF